MLEARLVILLKTYSSSKKKTKLHPTFPRENGYFRLLQQKSRRKESLVRNKKEVIEEARNKGRKVHFASLMDLCHLKDSELEPQYQKYKGMVVLRGDIVKDDSGSYAVFTEQGSSPSQMTAAKVMDMRSRLQGCSGQAADAVCACTTPRDQEGKSYQRVDRKQCTIWPSLGHCIGVQVQSLFQDQTVSWITIVSGIDKFVREATPIQEEEKASRKPASKARPILKPSSTSGWDFTLMEQRQWIDIEIQESKDPRCFRVSKFITRLLRHSKQVNREEEDAGVRYDQIIDECRKKLSDDTGYWSDEMMQQFANVPYWSLD